MTGNIDELAGDEMVCGDFRTNVHQRIFSDAEFNETSLGLDFCLRKMTALRLCDVFGLSRTGTQLNGDVTVTINGPLRHDLAIFKRQNGNGHVTAIFFEDARHADLLRDHASAHDLLLLNTEAHGDPFPAGMFNPNMKVTPSGLAFHALRRGKDGGRSHTSMDVRYPESLRDERP
jgi:hypothetical protein